MFRHSRFAALICALTVLLTVTVAVPGASAGTAAPTTVPVVFVHGFFHDSCPTPGLNVSSAMAGPTKYLSSSGWVGKLDVVSYYACDQGGTRIASDTVNTSIETIAAQLANYIYRTYSSRGQTVNVVTHSMGGLIIRAAVAYTESRTRGFPPYLLVKRVVSFSVPFDGVTTATVNAVPGLAGTYQGSQVLSGSNFIKTLQRAGTVDGSGGTDWLTVGSSGGCDIVSAASAVAVPDDTQVVYTGCWSHTQYLQNYTATRSYPAYFNSASTMTYGSLELMRLFLSLA